MLEFIHDWHLYHKESGGSSFFQNKEKEFLVSDTQPNRLKEQMTTKFIAQGNNNK